MLTKKDLIAYQKQNPSKYAHKYGHLNLDELPEEGFVNVEKAKTNLDGTPARPTVSWNDPINKGATVQSTVPEAWTGTKSPEPMKSEGTVTPNVNGGNTLESNK